MNPWIPRTKKALGFYFAALFLVVWAITLRPQAFGGPAEYIGISGTSMTPTMQNGDLAVVRKADDYKVGDVIAYRIPEGELGAGLKIIHRIVGGDAANGFITQGDNNDYTDVWKPTPNLIDGKVAVRLPGVASGLAKLRDPMVFAIVVGAITFLCLVWPRRSEKAVVPRVVASI